MRRILSVIACLGLFPASAFAGGAHQTNVDGVPYRWSDNVVYNLDRGDLKSGVAAYSHDSVAQMIAESFAAWRGTLTQGDLPVSEGAGLPSDGGADVNHRNQAGASALDWARRTNEKAMVDRLQRAGAR